MRISQLESIATGGGRIALWGWGREGRATHAALRSSKSAFAGDGSSAPLPLTVFCRAAEREEVLASGDPALSVEVDADAARLADFDVVIKSPGISPNRAEAVAARAVGTRFIGATAIWFAEHALASPGAGSTLCVTGTKGKSTTTALLAHLLRAGGHRTALAGNIGMPVLELPGTVPPPAFWAIELSSYQTGAVADSGVRPDIAIVTNLFPEHLDWHGSEARYMADKLRLVTDARPRVAVLNAADPRLAALSLPHGEVRWYGLDAGWHLEGDFLHRGRERVLDTSALPLPGRHNRSNLCAVLTAIEALGLDARALAPAANAFQPLPHRLQSLGVRDGVEYVNDSISTTPHATLAALECFRERRVAVLLGGHDRGIDWTAFADAMRVQAPLAIVTMGQNGPDIAARLSIPANAGRYLLAQADGLSEAMARAVELLGGEGVVLLSPGAPSFGPFVDYVDRGRRFAALAGFDPERISSIQGLGVH